MQDMHVEGIGIETPIFQLQSGNFTFSKYEENYPFKLIRK